MDIPWLGHTGPSARESDPKDPGPGRKGPDPLARVCAQLNFQHSLVHEADRLRTSVTDVLLDVATTLEQVAATWDRCADYRRGPDADRYREHAARIRDDLAVSLRRVGGAFARSIGEPRPPEPEPPTAVAV
jgi:hypothetical protein